MTQKQDIVTILGSESNRNGSQNSHSKVTSELDIWSSILKQKNKDEASQSKSPPYIHPLVKNSKNYLSAKSLEICTESLGSETGSDGFSSYASSEVNNSNDDENLKQKVDMVKKIRSFPPPLPSLFSQSQPLQMTPQRDNGRLFLFLQVVSIPSHNNLFAKRKNGRLILTFNNDEEELGDEFEEDESVKEKTQMLSSEITSTPNLELAVNKTIWLLNKRPKCSKFNQVSNFEDVKFVQHGSLPMINGYEYYWRNKATGNVAPSDQENSISNKVVNVVSGNMNINQASNEASQDSQQLFVLRGVNKDYLVHGLKFCKDSRIVLQQ